MNKINQNIDLNLNLIYNRKRQRAYVSDLTNVEEEHMMQYEATSMADKLVDVGVITRNRELCEITSFGLDVMEKFGGWGKYLEYVQEQEEQKRDYLHLKEELDLEHVRLQKENLEYVKANRALDEELRKLSHENLKFQRQRYWIGVAATLLGGILGALLL